MPPVSNNYWSLNLLQIEAFPLYLSSTKYFKSSEVSILSLIIVSLTELPTLCTPYLIFKNLNKYSVHQHLKSVW